MKDKKQQEHLIDMFLKNFDYPKGDIYDGESILRMLEYVNWLKENGLKATPDGYPEGVKKKQVTRPKGRNPKIVARNKEIREKYFNMYENEGVRPAKAYEMLAKEYGLSVSTIKTYTEKNR